MTCGKLTLEQFVAPWKEEPMLKQVCWQDLCYCGGPMFDKSIPEELHHMESTHNEAARELLACGKDSHIN